MEVNMQLRKLENPLGGSNQLQGKSMKLNHTIGIIAKLIGLCWLEHSAATAKTAAR